MVRSDAPDRPIVVRSRHRFRALAEISRQLDGEHMRLLPGCDLVITDLSASDVRSAGSVVRIPLPRRSNVAQPVAV